eukprot:TRINITY_DN2165_c1_g1_i1.p1 TRINITY_DN2165_c1_g1~~TRINITY_DN2165_c1_g1_i1.p1  ORF type:complete len:278 (-),score=63.61 TRINITY_DN2165_c1_g1_i1:110-892(-)
MSVLVSLGQIFLIDISIQLAGFAIAVALGTEKFYDLVGSSTFVLLSLFTFLTSERAPRQLFATGLVLTWSLRLGPFLFYRVLQQGKDKRFDKAKAKPLLFLIYWLIQGVWIFLTALPIYLLNVTGENTPFGITDYIGGFLWVAGFSIETIADFQKLLFRSKAENQDKWINTGLWRYSRHPNYFGEIVLWWGAFFVAFGGLPWLPWRVISVVSPLFLMFLLIRVSGLPPLERAADAKWGKNPKYLEYKQNTSALIPLPPKN